MFCAYFFGGKQHIPYDGCTAEVDVEGDLGLKNGRHISFISSEKWELKEPGLGVVGLCGREFWEQPKLRSDVKNFGAVGVVVSRGRGLGKDEGSRRQQPEGLKYSYLSTIWILENSLETRLPAIKMLGGRNSPRTFSKDLYCSEK